MESINVETWRKPDEQKENLKVEHHVRGHNNYSDTIACYIVIPYSQEIASTQTRNPDSNLPAEVTLQKSKPLLSHQHGCERYFHTFVYSPQLFLMEMYRHFQIQIQLKIIIINAQKSVSAS